MKYKPNNQSFFANTGVALTQFHEAIGNVDYETISSFAKEFLEEAAPVQYGETLWTGLVKSAEHHHLPIYNLHGELLWPKQMTHEQVAQFVAKKSEEKKRRSWRSAIHPLFPIYLGDLREIFNMV